jgi:large subunit ribosomal protein L7/L12
MSDHSRLMLFGSFVFLLLGAAAQAATVYLVSGEVAEPEGLNEGDSLRAGDTVRTGQDGVVMIEYRWRSDVQGYDCQHLQIFGYGASHTVTAIETPGQCATRVPAAVPEDGNFSTAATRYGDASFDDMNPPARVTNSRAQSLELDRWVRNAEQIYTGKVEDISNREIDVKGARSSSARNFSLTESALAGHADRNALVGKNVRVTYRSGGFRPEAIRIEVPGAAAVGQPFVILEVDPGVFQPGGTVAPDPAPQPPAATPQTWRCKVDLHQGDVGELQLTRTDERIRGAIYIERTDDKHAIRGTWQKDKIEFWRELSQSSGQNFVGSVTKTSEHGVVMGGRFAHQYSGVWSADCSLVTGGGPGAEGAPGLFEVVLTGYEGDKIAAIKSVRAVTGMGLKDAKDAVEQPPTRLFADLSEDEAGRIAKKLTTAGLKIRVQAQ